MSRYWRSRAFSTRIARVAAILIVVLLTGWLAVQLSAGSGDLREVRLEELIDDVNSDGSLVVNWEATSALLHEIAGGSGPMEEILVSDLLEKTPRVRVSFEGTSLMLYRRTLTRLVRTSVGNEVVIEKLRVGDLLDKAADLRVSPLLWSQMQSGGSRPPRPQMINPRTVVSELMELFGEIERVDHTQDPQFDERRELQLQYEAVLKTLKDVRLEMLATGDQQAVFNQAFSRLLDTDLVDAFLLLQGQQRLEKELGSARLDSMSRPERISFRWEARRRAFGLEIADLLFNRKEAMERYEIDRLAIEADPYTTAQEKAEIIQERRETLKVELATQGIYVGFPDESVAEADIGLREPYGDKVKSIRQSQAERAGTAESDLRGRRSP